MMLQIHSCEYDYQVQAIGNYVKASVCPASPVTVNMINISKQSSAVVSAL